MRVLIYKCSKCKQEIYSRARHDFISCKCKKLMLDGGHYDDSHLLWVPERLIGEITADKRIVNIDVAPKQLYNDWNTNINKYGVYKDGKRKEE